jgi:hypothetical protein
VKDLHPDIQEKLDWFNPEDFGSDVRWIVDYCQELAFIMAAIPNHPELVLGLQNLVDAQSCFVAACAASAKLDTQLLAANPEVAKAIDDFIADPSTGHLRTRPPRGRGM